MKTILLIFYVLALDAIVIWMNLNALGIAPP